MKLILIGFMGSGKSTVGRELARRLGLDFFDTDELVQKKTRMKISEIFKNGGEPYFRQVEEEIIQNLPARDRCVIAAGGGAVLNKTNVKNLKKKGTVVYLKVPFSVLKERLSGVSDRPLLEGSGSRSKKIKTMLESRQNLYESSADVIINCGRKSPEEIATLIMEKLAYSPKILKASFRQGESRIIIGNEVFFDFPYWWKWKKRKVALVTHPFLARQYFEAIADGLEEFNCQVEAIALPSGERSKSLRTAEKIYNQLFQKEFLRSDFIFALGGGVVGDVAGFVAATYMRGLNLVQIPTTLLSQVDSSIGGKTGVNVSYGKNLIGSFYQPVLTLIDLSFLKTLPRKEFFNGLAEIIKMAFLFSPSLVAFLEEHLGELLALKPETWQKVVIETVSYKLRLVEDDEMETKGKRSFLNYGHTVGHALEKLSLYRGISHGEAVAIGMMMEAKISAEKGFLSKEELKRQESLLKKAGLPVKVPEKYRPELVRAMLLDKKRDSEEIKIVGLKGIGKPLLLSLSPEEMEKTLSRLNDC